MKPNKRNRLFSPLRTACTATLLLCQPVFAGVWTNVDTGGVPDLNARYVWPMPMFWPAAGHGQHPG